MTTIPKVLHQVWIGPLPPPEWLMATWRQAHPQWTYKLWDNAAVARETWECREQLDAMQEWNGKADILRWEILWREGGVLVDADSKCVRPLDESFLEDESFACWEHEVACPGLIAAGYVGACKGSPLMRRCIDAVKARDVASARACTTVGPFLLTEMARDYQGLRVYPARTFIPMHHTGVPAPGRSPIFAEQLWGSTFGYDRILGRR